MGRKGVSKRKPGKVKSKLVGDGVASGSVSSVVHAIEGQPGRSMEVGKGTTSTLDSGKPTTNRKKSPRK